MASSPYYSSIYNGSYTDIAGNDWYGKKIIFQTYPIHISRRFLNDFGHIFTISPNSEPEDEVVYP